MIKKMVMFFLLLTFMSGCYDYKEVGNLAICVGMGIDRGSDERYLVTVQILHPFSKNNGESNIIVYQAEGKTIKNAIKNLYYEMPLDLFIGHLQVVIFSKEVASDSLHDALEYFIRDREASKNAELLIGLDKAGDILKVLTLGYQVPAVKIKQNLEQGEKNLGAILQMKIDDFVALAARTGIEPYIPTVKLTNKDFDSIDLDKDNIEASDPNTRIALAGTAVFKDYQMKSLIEKDESVGLSMIKDINSKYLISFKCDQSKEASVLATEFSSSKSGEYQDGKLVFRHKVKMQAALSEYPCGGDLRDKAINDEIIRKATESINYYLTTAFEAFTNKYHLDVFGYQEYFYRFKNGTWKKIKDQFDTLFTNTEVHFDIEFKLVKSGATVGNI